MKQSRFKLGTSSLTVAAFVGPGTVLTCATAGIDFGYVLGWVLLFSVGATFVLQSFTAGAGIWSRLGMGEALRVYTERSPIRWIVSALVVLGLWAGTAAFETGNIAGAVAGVSSLTSGLLPRSVLVLLIGPFAAAALSMQLQMVIKLLAGLVALMSAVFLVTVILAPVDWQAALQGLMIPRIPDGSLVRTIALVGTTVVTYNLFLHGSAAKKYWAHEDPQFAWLRELTGMAIFLPLGGIISVAILLAGATLEVEAVESVAAIAPVIRPAAGPFAEILFGMGLFAAGITSAVTAPLAAACGVREIFGWPDDVKHPGFRVVWISVLLTGMMFALFGRNPLEIIVAAQAANGLLLPFIAVFVLFLAVRQKTVALPHWYLGLGILVTLICAGLGGRTLIWVWGQLN
ncbi:MAG: divalent metal cation transporter [Rhodothermaceae bacterium]|nr:divalent metal cation transporter [Rhodothermaceae bacterium]